MQCSAKFTSRFLHRVQMLQDCVYKCHQHLLQRRLAVLAHTPWGSISLSDVAVICKHPQNSPRDGRHRVEMFAGVAHTELQCCATQHQRAEHQLAPGTYQSY